MILGQLRTGARSTTYAALWTGCPVRIELDWISPNFTILVQKLNPLCVVYKIFDNFCLQKYVFVLLCLFKVTNVMQDSLVHSSGMRVKSVSSSAVLSFCRDALGSFDKWLRAAAISITTFFYPSPSGFQVVGFSFWDFPNKWGGWRPRKTNNKASEILTSDSRMRKLRSQVIRWRLSTDLL